MYHIFQSMSEASRVTGRLTPQSLTLIGTRQISALLSVFTPFSTAVVQVYVFM
jgi:hypothetical protein